MLAIRFVCLVVALAVAVVVVGLRCYSVCYSTHKSNECHSICKSEVIFSFEYKRHFNLYHILRFYRLFFEPSNTFKYHISNMIARIIPLFLPYTLFDRKPKFNIICTHTHKLTHTVVPVVFFLFFSLLHILWRSISIEAETIFSYLISIIFSYQKNLHYEALVQIIQRRI